MSRIKIILPILLSTGLLAACSKPPCFDGASAQCQQIRDNHINGLNKRGVQVVRLIAKTLVFLPSDKIFSDNSAKLSANGEYLLNNVTVFLRSYPGAKFKVSAYTDNVLPKKIRNKLSQEQAREVAGYLWTNNIPAKYQRLHFGGRGDKTPIASNKYYFGSAENRRVVITIIPYCCQVKSADKNSK